MKSPNEEAKERLMERRRELAEELKKTFSEQWILEIFGTDHLDIGDRWTS